MMSQRLSEYLTRETTEYLEQLDTLLASQGAPDAEDLVRLARGVRGSAEMGGLETIAAVAERLEDAGRSLLSNAVVWSEEIRELAIQTVRDLQILLRALNRWGPNEEARVRAAILRWEERETADASEIVSVSDLYFDDAGPHIVSGPANPDVIVVPIDTLLYHGEGAIREALRIRPEVELAARRGSPSEITAVLSELFDLVELGLSNGPRPEE